MILYFGIFILIAFLIYYYLVQIEHFEVPYRTESSRDLTSKQRINDNKLITRYKKDYVQTLNDYDDYTELQRYLRDVNEVKGSNPYTTPKVTKDLRWNIHRWSMWDYIKDWNYPYYCKVREYNGNEKCIPLTKKRYCTINRLYTDPYKCLTSLKKYSQ